MCQQHGDTWDLAFINWRHEFSYLVDLIDGNCLENKEFWFGWKKDGKEYNTIFNKDSHWKIKFDKKKPPKGTKDYECVRLVNGRFTRVPCTSTSGAYVCENHNYAR